jgi:FkbM family methyltransferase
MRGGGALWMRPQYDGLAMGELFIAESYAELFPKEPVRIAWDIGGNIGCFAIWLFRRQPNAQITSFEPCAETFAVLSKNQAEWKNYRWEIRPYGLSDRDQQVEAFTPIGNYGETSRHVRSGTPTELRLRNVATVWKEEGGPAVDFLKIDCEGDEYEIISAIPDGMWSSLENILVEIHSRPDKNPQTLRDTLMARGFHIRQGTVNPELWLASKSSV